MPNNNDLLDKIAIIRAQIVKMQNTLLEIKDLKTKTNFNDELLNLMTEFNNMTDSLIEFVETQIKEHN